MTFWEFIASMTDSLAWPGLILTFILLFRESITRILAETIPDKIAGLKELEFRGSKASFAPKTVAKARARAADETAKSPQQLGLPPDINDIIDATPNLAIVRIWAALENELAEALNRAYHWSDTDSHVNSQALQGAGHIDSDDGSSLFSMKRERNRAARKLLSSETIVDLPLYLKVAEYLIDKLQKIAPEQDD